MSSTEKIASQDLRRIVGGWPYEPGKITVRSMTGTDGRERIQMRLDLGVLQMEKDGRPDGMRPKGCKSLLEYHQRRLEKFEAKNETDLGFHLSGEECQALRDESIMYYHRYLSLFVLEDFARVERDTTRNCLVLDLCSKYAAEEWDRLVLEQYRPYIVMMNTRSKAMQSMKAGMYKTAMAHLETGMSTIKNFFDDYGRPEAFEEASEIHILESLRGEISQRLPIGAPERLQRKLDRALAEERYEDAARIRDQIRLLEKKAKADG